MNFRPLPPENRSRTLSYCFNGIEPADARCKTQDSSQPIRTDSHNSRTPSNMRMAACGGQSRRSIPLLQQPTPECPLFPKADVQNTGYPRKSRAAFGKSGHQIDPNTRALNVCFRESGHSLRVETLPTPRLGDSLPLFFPRPSEPGRQTRYVSITNVHQLATVVTRGFSLNARSCSASATAQPGEP